MKIEVKNLTDTNISIRAETDYREAGSLGSALRCLQASCGFIHLAAPPGSLELDELKRFHVQPTALSRILGTPTLRAFWLIAHQLPHSSAASEGTQQIVKSADHQPLGNAAEEIAYTWLFIQPAAISHDVWHRASTEFSKEFGRPVICRSRQDEAVTICENGARRLVTCESAESVLDTIAVNAAPLAWGQPFARVYPSGLSTPSGPFSLYAAVPHCNSSRMMFAYRNILKGGE